MADSFTWYMGHVKRIWYLLPKRAAKVQASLHIRAVSPEPPLLCAGSPEPSLLAHTSNESRGTFRQKARSLAPLNGWACAVKIFHDRMLEDTNSLDAAHIQSVENIFKRIFCQNSVFSRNIHLRPVKSHAFHMRHMQICFFSCSHARSLKSHVNKNRQKKSQKLKELSLSLWQLSCLTFFLIN